MKRLHEFGPVTMMCPREEAAIRAYVRRVPFVLIDSKTG